MSYKVLLLAVFLTACSAPGPDYLEPGNRYTIEQPLGHPAMSFKIPENGRWLTYVKDIEQIDKAITIDKETPEGFVTSMTLGMVEGTSDRIALEHRQSLKQFLIDGDMKAYFTRKTSRYVDGRQVKRVPGTYFEFNDIKCMSIGNFQPRKVALGVYLDGVMISCYIVVDGQLRKMFMKRSFAVKEYSDKTDYKNRKQQAAVGSKDYDLDLIFPEDLKEIRDSIRIMGNKISQNYDDVEERLFLMFLRECRLVKPWRSTKRD